jgi:hypothetical protein
LEQGRSKTRLVDTNIQGQNKNTLSIEKSNNGEGKINLDGYWIYI